MAGRDPIKTMGDPKAQPVNPKNPISLNDADLPCGSFRKLGGTLFWGPYVGYHIRVPYFRKLRRLL